VTDPDLTLIAALLDRSASMTVIASATEEGFRGFLAEQAKLPGRLEVTLAQFDHHYQLMYAPTPVADVPEFVLDPRGNTALLDAMGRFITETGEELAARPEHERPGTVIVVVMTDGEENASREWHVGAIRKLVEQQRERWQWQFIFLGANIDAIKVGRDYGFRAGQTITYGANDFGTHSVMDSVNAVATATRSGTVAAFTDQDRAAALGE
jgi:hypothetical protein